MTLLVPLLLTTVIVRAGAKWLAVRGHAALDLWASWSAAMAIGMSAVYVCTALTHFVEPQRSGLIAIVPEFVPFPQLAVTFTGCMEIMLAVGLVIPRTRCWAGIASVAMLLAIFPANVVAAGGVDHPAAPTTPLAQRAVLQIVFIAFSAAAIRFRRAGTEKEVGGGSIARYPAG